MELVFELITAALFDLSMLLLVLRLAAGKGHTNQGFYRFLSATFGVGFLMSIAANRIANGSIADLVLLMLGFMLSYTAFVFTFPITKKERPNEIH